MELPKRAFIGLSLDLAVEPAIGIGNLQPLKALLYPVMLFSLSTCNSVS